MPGVFDTLPVTLPLKRCGFQVVRHGRPELFATLKERFESTLAQRLTEFIGRPIRDFRAERYHETLVREGIDHHKFIQATRRKLPSEWYREDAHLAGLIARVSELTGLKLRPYNDVLEYRVVRPNQDDNNPWHRDHWFPYFEPLVNVYLPMSGSYIDSALQVVPFSHEWTEEDVVPTFPYEGGKTNKGGVLYSVPEIKSTTKEIRGHRPDVIPGDFMLFSPKAVHGSGSNSGPETRFSFEFRLERVPENA